jgi:hypothetical protein
LTVRIVLFVRARDPTLQHRHAHRIPHPTFRDDRETPLSIGHRTRAIDNTFWKKESKIFSPKRLDGMISLNRFVKMSFYA